MKHKFSLAAFCLAALVAESGAAENTTKLSETRGTLEKWVETRQLISKTRADWQTDRETINQTISLLERELKSVEEQFGKLNTNSTQADKERLEAESLLKASNEGLAPALKFGVDFEAKIRSLAPRLPMPLQETLKPLFARLPADGANSKMKVPERLQVLVGLLNEVDKFNYAVTVFSEKRKNGAGAEISVETVYVGLGAAYFVNEAGNFAGVGSPGASGWDWTINPEIAARVREVIRIYRNERPAKFVSLPVAIK